MNLKKSLSAFLISTILTGCSLSRISLKIDYRPFPITLKMSQNGDGSYGAINFWPNKLAPFFDRNKNGNFELEDLTKTYHYIKKFNFSKELKKRKKKNQNKISFKTFFLERNKQLNFYFNKK